MTLPILDRLTAFKELWTLTMPAECPVPPSQTFVGWLGNYTDDELQFAVIKTGGRKLAKKLSEGLSMNPQDADRYCSSILSKTYQAQQRQTVRP